MTLIAYARRKRAKRGVCLTRGGGAASIAWASGLCVDDDPERGSAAVRLAFPSSNHFMLLLLLLIFACLFGRAY